MSYFKERRLHLDDTINISLETFMQAETLARKYEIDLSDALQIITVKHGSFKNLACESKTVLATGDAGLAPKPQNKKDYAFGIVKRAQSRRSPSRIHEVGSELAARLPFRGVGVDAPVF
jgi:hypothetical protein